MRRGKLRLKTKVAAAGFEPVHGYTDVITAKLKLTVCPLLGSV